jgi:hypothetical protein
MFLSQEELVELTGKKRSRDQIDALKYMRVPHFVNTIGKPVVVRDNLLAGMSHTEAKAKWQPKITAT